LSMLPNTKQSLLLLAFAVLASLINSTKLEWYLKVVFVALCFLEFLVFTAIFDRLDSEIGQFERKKVFE